MSKALLGSAVALVLAAVHSLTMTGPAQGASCRSEYDLCRRVRANPVRTKPNPAMIGSCEVRYVRAQRTGIWKNRFGGIRECSL
jgi:hypothetical protein